VLPSRELADNGFVRQVDVSDNAGIRYDARAQGMQHENYHVLSECCAKVFVLLLFLSGKSGGKEDG
jgi:hypothetical protein